jgi:uncharacterized membrane protein YjgN (DUF898 family)
MESLMNWHYKIEGRKVGPISQTEMDRLVKIGLVRPDTMVWNDYSNRWQTYNEAVNGSSDEDADEPWAPYKGPGKSFQQNSAEPPKYRPVFTTPLSYETCHQIEFTGSGSEYFRIWIVNLLLTVATLGIYSAWAKVRRNKYFYRNTRIAGSSFDYHGRPIAILKGRLIAALLLGTLFLFKNIIPDYYLFGLVVFGAFVPWLVTKSLAFRMRNTSWRSMRFRFDGTVRKAAKVFYIHGLLSMLSGGIFYPLFYHRQKAFLFNNVSFGRESGNFGISSAPFFGVILKTAGITALAGMSIFFLSSTMLATILQFFGTKIAVLFLIPVLIYLSFIFIGFPFYQVNMTNLIWNNFTLGSLSFASSLKFSRFAWITLCNTLFTLITLGLYWPWAVVNLTRYRAESITLVAQNGLDQFEAGLSDEESAAAHEITDAYDFDISF